MFKAWMMRMQHVILVILSLSGPLLLLDLIVEGNLEIFQRSLHSTAAKIAPVLFIKLDEDGH